MRNFFAAMRVLALGSSFRNPKRCFARRLNAADNGLGHPFVMPVGGVTRLSVDMLALSTKVAA
jgi:hypothetical protein